MDFLKTYQYRVFVIWDGIELTRTITGMSPHSRASSYTSPLLTCHDILHVKRPLYVAKRSRAKMKMTFQPTCVKKKEHKHTSVGKILRSLASLSFSEIIGRPSVTAVTRTVRFGGEVISWLDGHGVVWRAYMKGGYPVPSPGRHLPLRSDQRPPSLGYILGLG